MPDHQICAVKRLLVDNNNLLSRFETRHVHDDAWSRSLSPDLRTPDLDEEWFSRPSPRLVHIRAHVTTAVVREHGVRMVCPDGGWWVDDDLDEDVEHPGPRLHHGLYESRTTLEHLDIGGESSLREDAKELGDLTVFPRLTFLRISLIMLHEPPPNSSRRPYVCVHCQRVRHISISCWTPALSTHARWLHWTGWLHSPKIGNKVRAFRI